MYFNKKLNKIKKSKKITSSKKWTFERLSYFYYQMMDLPDKKGKDGLSL